MILSDVIKSIPLYKYSGSLSDIAEELGLNISPDNIMYLGDNPNVGFHFSLSNSILIKLYSDGSDFSGTGYSSISTNSELATLYYVKGKDTICFGVSNTGKPVLNFICGKCRNLIDGTEKYGYVSCVGSTSGLYGGGCVISDGYTQKDWFTYLTHQIDMFVSMYPMCTKQGDLFENMNVATIFCQSNEYKLFTLGNKNYLSLTGPSEGYNRLITEF